MSFIISNPWGFLGLLGIPAVLLIHFLQRRAQVVPCSTLFLLQQTKKESVNGSKFDKLVHSIPLWMQLLLVLLATLLLIQPRYVSAQSTQRIAIVLDSSASMSVFKDQAKAKILEQIPAVQQHAAHVELWLLDSDISKDRIYHGDSIEDLEAALESWEPSAGSSDPHHMLRVARSLTGYEGAILYITDTPVESIPYNTTVHSIGESRENVGFTGVTFEDRDELIWKASIRNYSQSSVTKSWRLQVDSGAQTEARDVQLAPGELKVISGPFPENTKRITIQLSDDAFSYDNELPLVVPSPKSLDVFAKCSEGIQPLAQKIIETFDGLKASSEEQSTDLSLLSFPAETEKFGINPAIVFLEGSAVANTYVSTPIVAADHKLTEGLNWSSLLISGEKRFTQSKWDTPLVWSGEEVIISLREVPLGLQKSHKQLVFNFNLLESNANKQEAVALLIYRFLKSQKKNKKALVSQVTELGQPLGLKVEPEGRNVIVETINLLGEVVSTQELNPKQPIHAIDHVGYYSIKQGDDYLLHASNYYADTREADLSKCEPGVLEASSDSRAIDRHSEQDHLWRLWLILILASLSISWLFSKNSRTA